MNIQQELYACQLCKRYLSAIELDGHECSTSSTTELKLNKPDSQPQSDDTVLEVLIGLVHSKRPLWDHRLPVLQRGKNEKDRLWSEIWQAMGGVLTMENLQKKWKNLRDQFMKTKVQVDTYVASGSETPCKKNVWKHYESLKFLQDTVQPKQTSSNLTKNLLANSPLTVNLSSGSSASLPEMLSPVNSIGTKRKRKQEHFEESLLAILEKPIQLPAPASQPSASMVLASSLLEKLPMRVRMKAEREFINKLYDLVDEHVEDM